MTRPQAPASLLRRVVSAQILTLLVCWLVVLGLITFQSLRTRNGDFDKGLILFAQALARCVDGETDPARLFATARNLDQVNQEIGGLIAYEGGGYQAICQVWDAQDRLLYRSPGAPLTPLTASKSGLENARIAGRTWRVAALPGPSGQIRVQAAESFEARGRMLARVSLEIFQPLLLILPLGGILTWWTARRGLGPVTELARAVEARKPTDLQPLRPASDLRETMPLVKAINALMARLSAVLASQRRFLGDAAHELQTPLAVVGVQAHALANASQPEERARAMEALQSGLRRASGLIHRLLTVAHLDGVGFLPEMQDVDLVPLVRVWVADMMEAALRHDVEVSLEADPRVPLRTDAGCLRHAFDNLLDNAIRHIPAGGHVEIRVQSLPPGAWIRIADDGPGIPVPERDRVFDRFYRLPDTIAPGSGLGLPLAKQVLTLLGGTVRLTEGLEGRGLGVEIEL